MNPTIFSTLRVRWLAPVLALAVLLAACGTPAPAPTGEPAAPAAEETEAADEPTEEAAEETVEEPTEEATEPAPAAPTENLTGGCVEDYAEGVDYFPAKVELEYAAGFSVEYHDNYKVVEVPAAWPGAEESFRYVLVQCGTPVPEGFDEAAVIEVPAGDTVVMSTSFVTNLDDLGVLDRLTGLDSLAFVMNPAVRARIDAGEVSEIAPMGTVNIEETLSLDPALIMAFSAGIPEYDSYPVLIDAGLPVVLNADWMERTPLARAEWVKFVALFYNAEARANEVFGGVASRYEEAAALAATAAERPTVLTDTPYEGTWYVPGGQSYSATLLRDAGADYIWAEDESTGTLYLDFETVFDEAQDAEYWLNIWGYDSRAAMLAVDERFGDFRAFQEGRVYAFDARSSDVSTEYWETGVAHPDVILQDMIEIFHPDLLPDHELYYYRQLPEAS